MVSFSTSNRWLLTIVLVGLAAAALPARTQTAPDPPTMGVAVAYSRASITFTAPANDGGATITSYTATSSPGGITGTLSGATKSADTAAPIHVHGLTAGQTYTFTITATNSAGTSLPSSASNSVTMSSSLLPTGYNTDFSAAGAGEIPARATECATIAAATYNNGTTDATAGIQAALDSCTLGQTVKLGDGVFRVATPIYIRRGVTLRGSGIRGAGLSSVGNTILHKHNAFGATSAQDRQDPLVIMGPSNSPLPTESTSVNLTADGTRGSLSVTVANASGFSEGEIVKIDSDEYTGNGNVIWENFPLGLPSRPNLITVSNDRLWWPVKCVPGQDIAPTGGDGETDCTLGTHPDDAVFPNRAGSMNLPAAFSWFNRYRRVIGEIKEIDTIVGNVITFTTPLYIDYPVAKTAQLVRYVGTNNVHVRGAGIEDLTMVGGSNGALVIKAAAYSWASNVEVSQSGGVGINIANSFRVTLTGFVVRHANHPYPGGGGYNIGVEHGSTEILMDNCISSFANKILTMRAGGAGSVVGYCYMENPYIGSQQNWMESGINSSHSVGTHNVLFEGNLSHAADQDDTWGSSIYDVFLRNHLTGDRPYYPDAGNVRTVGLGKGSYFNAFIGNVLGTSGGMTGWVYEDPIDGSLGNASTAHGGKALYRLGYNTGPIGANYAEHRTRNTVTREGNYDYLNNEVRWDRTATTIPDSMYLAAAPSYFDGYTWPWVEPLEVTKTYTLPAKDRSDALDAAATVPHAPIIQSVTRVGSLAVSVHFTPPFYNGGKVIKTFTVTASPGGQTGVTTGPTAKATPIVVGGLSLNETYTFTVTASNDVGTSASSAASDPITLTGTVPPTSDIARVQYCYGANNGTAVTPQTCTFDDPVTAGNLVIVYARTKVSPPNGSITVTGSDGTTFDAHPRAGNNNEPQMYIYSKVKATTGELTVSCNYNTAATVQFCFAVEYEPGAGAVWDTDPGDRYYADSDGSQTFTINIATPVFSTVSGGLLIMAATQPPAATYTEGTGFTLITQINASGANFGAVQELITADPLEAFIGEMESTSNGGGRVVWGFFNTTPSDDPPPASPRRPVRFRILQRP